MNYLSDEQMNCIGVPGNASPTWSLVELPVGPQPLPDWAKGLHVDFGDHHDGDPRFTLKTDRDLRAWPGKRYRRDGDLWMSETDDGLADPFYQGGELRIERLRRYKTKDGALHQYAPTEPRRIRLVPGEWIEIDRLCTRQEQGFGGAHIDLVMVDGTEVTLRGPWHGPCPSGFVEVAALDTSSPYYRHAYNRNKPWHSRCVSGVATVRADVFTPIFARYAPHLRLASVNMGRGDRLQPLKPEWNEPKAWVRARERMARKQAAYDAMTPAERPPHVACNWPKVCGGKAHCAVAECNHCTPRKAA